MFPFHLAFKVNDLESTFKFYHVILGCKVGRKASNWIDFDFYGHQLSAHYSKQKIKANLINNRVDNESVSIPHFGLIVNCLTFEKLVNRFKNYKIQFLIEPQIRFKGKPGEQRIMFIKDYSDNIIEFKCFSNKKELFNI